MTLDHWNAKIAIEALRAGEDGHGERPLTLIIEVFQKIYKLRARQAAAFNHEALRGV